MYVHVPPCDRDPPDPVRRADPWMEHPRSQVSSLPAGHPLAGAVSGGRRGHGFLCPRDEYVLRSMLTDPVGIVVWPIEAPGPRLQPRPFCHLVQRHRAHGPVASGPKPTRSLLKARRDERWAAAGLCAARPRPVSLSCRPRGQQISRTHDRTFHGRRRLSRRETRQRILCYALLMPLHSKSNACR